MRSSRIATVLVLFALVTAPALAGDWPHWRGPSQNGSSTETGLVSSWSATGENLIWKTEFVGRSTPVVLHGRVCVIGRTGEGAAKQEVVACYDAGSGKKLWEHRHNAYHTTVAFNRLGWASLAGDPATGNIYAHGAAGQLIAFDKNGKILWEHFTLEQFGRLSGYGGRTQTPLVWGDQLLITYVSVGWGDQARPRHRYYSFDKNTGEVLWISTPSGMPFDMNTQSGPVVAEIDGRHLLIAGNADGYIHAVDVGTGDPVWKFQLSRRGLNSTVVVDGDVVFASHSEENVDDAVMGRVVAFRGTGSGEINDQEIWRINELSAGFPTPAFADGKLYYVDNSANMFRVDPADGAIDWEYKLGTVGKASPVVAEGKIYVPETNGRFHILKITDDAAVKLDEDELKSEGDRYSENYGSAAIAYGRIYLSTEGTLYCIGDKRVKFKATDTTPPAMLPAGSGEPARVQVVPAEVAVRPGETVSFTVRLFDAKGLPLGKTKAQWSVAGAGGEISKGGKFKATATGGAGGTVVATVGELSGAARVRVIPELPWSSDFAAAEVDSTPPYWMAALGKYKVVEKDGAKVLQQAVVPRGVQRRHTFIGGDDSNYTIEADVMGGQIKRRMTDVGLMNAGYTMDLMGYHQRIELRSWAAERRMAQTTDFAWEMGVWYRMKFDVSVVDGKAILRGKVWKRGTAEPQEWTITATDSLPITHGSPGLVGYAPTEIYYDNIRITPNG